MLSSNSVIVFSDASLQLQVTLNVQVILLKFSRTMNGDGYKWPGMLIDDKPQNPRSEVWCRFFFSPLRQVRVAATNIMPGRVNEVNIVQLSKLPVIDNLIWFTWLTQDQNFRSTCDREWYRIYILPFWQWCTKVVSCCCFLNFLTQQVVMTCSYRDLFRDSDLDAAISQVNAQSSTIGCCAATVWCSVLFPLAQSLDEAAASPQKATSKVFIETLQVLGATKSFCFKSKMHIVLDVSKAVLDI